MTRSIFGEECVYFSYTSASQTIIEGSEGKNSSRNLETGTEAQTMEECGLLPCFPYYSACSYTIQDQLPRVELPIVG